MSAQARALRHWVPPKDESFMAALAGERFRGQEGTASRAYFQQIARYLAGRVPFGGRQSRPAYDAFNALLNYLYGMMYTSVHLALLKSGLDPYMAVLHADQYGAKPTLAFDTIEPYRPWADEVAISLADSGQVSNPAFVRPDAEAQGWWLSSIGKGAAIEAMLGFLKTPTAFEGRQVRRSVQIDLEAQKLAVFLKEYKD